jgi:serine/arginine repetitive matrix protein 2
VLEAITRKIGLSGPFDNSGFPIGAEILSPGDRAVDPGDRYPTTGLNPPCAFNIEEVRSFFSDDSSQSERGGSFRKRLTGLKAKRAGISRAHSVDGDYSIGRENDSFFANGRSRSGGSVHTYDGTAGMSKFEFRARKMVERLKSLWFRGGEILRSFGRKKPEEGVEDSNESSALYSGV